MIFTTSWPIRNQDTHRPLSHELPVTMATDSTLQFCKEIFSISSWSRWFILVVWLAMRIAYWAQRTQRTMHPLNCIVAMVYGLQSMRGHLKVVQDFQGRMYPTAVPTEGHDSAKQLSGYCQGGQRQFGGASHFVSLKVYYIGYVAKIPPSLHGTFVTWLIKIDRPHS